MQSQTDSAAAFPEHERVVRKRVRVVGEKICEVCGDKALAHHFGALSCETCKAFFRRNAARLTKMKRSCSDGTACIINKNTRKNCPACRLKKCFSVGMKAELIFDEERKQKMNEKTQKSRSKRQSQKDVPEAFQEQHSVTSDPVSTFGTQNNGSSSSDSFSYPTDGSESINQNGAAGNIMATSESGDGHSSSSTGFDSGAVSSGLICQSGTEICQMQERINSICPMGANAQEKVWAQTCAHSAEQAQNRVSTVSCESVSANQGFAQSVLSQAVPTEHPQSLCQIQTTAVTANINTAGPQVLQAGCVQNERNVSTTGMLPTSITQHSVQPQTANLQAVIDSGCSTLSQESFAHVSSIFPTGDVEMHQNSAPQCSPDSRVEASGTGSKDTSNRNIQEVFRPSRPNLGQMSLDQLPSDPLMYWRLSEEERMLLTLLSSRYENVVLAELQKRIPNFDMSQYTLHEFLTDYELLIRQAVLFAKQLEDFKKLTLDDQVACIKGSISGVMIVRSAFTFIVERSTWITLRGELTVETFRKLFPGHPMPDSVLGTYHSLKSVLKNDSTLYALLHCILIFDPACDRISDRQLVSMMQDKYFMLLRHYLESTFSYTYAKQYERYFQDKILEIADVTDFNNKHIKVPECEEGLQMLVPFELLYEVHS